MRRSLAPKVAKVERELATERVEVRLTPAQLAAWTKLAERQGITIKALVVAAVDSYADRDAASELADLGRDVLSLVRDRFPADPRRLR